MTMHKLQVTNRMTCLCLVEREQPGAGVWAMLEILCLSPCPHVLLLDITETHRMINYSNCSIQTAKAITTHLYI